MPITPVPNVPQSGLEIIGRALQDLLPADDAKGGRSMVGEEEVKISQPIPVYRLLPRDLLKTQSVESAEQVGWRYVVLSEASLPGFVDLIGVGQEVRFARLAQNRNSEKFLAALHRAREEATRSSQSCEIRSLDVPSLHVAAVWVTSLPPAFVPYIAPPEVSSGTLSVDYEFVGKLVTAAETDRAFRDARPTPRGLP